MLNKLSSLPKYLHKTQHWAVGGFFVILFALGFALHGDYGISYDEAISRQNGLVSLRYVAEKINPAWVESDPQLASTPSLHQYLDRDYGVFFELPAAFAERLLQLTEAGQWYRFRHLLTYLVCLVGVWAMYKLGTFRYRDRRLGLAVAGALVVSPRMFAEMFYNDKDLVFMALFALSMYTGVRFLTRPTWRTAAWHALASAATIDVRIMGVLLPVVTVAVLLVLALRREVSLSQTARLTIFYLLLFGATAVACWPYLWENPFGNFVQAFKNMTVFRWDGTVLYRGEYVKATELPWHYVPVWIGITTPIPYLLTFAVGVGAVLRQVFRRSWLLWQTPDELQDLLMLAFCAGPVVAVVALHSVLYDGWRQLYFVYPALLLLALRGAVALGQWKPAVNRWGKQWAASLIGTTVLALVPVAWGMVRDHPLQNVYFNLLAGDSLRQKYELDYWGLSFRQGLEFVVRNDRRPRLRIASSGDIPCGESMALLPDNDRARLQLVPRPDSAEYFLSNYRWHPQEYPGVDEVHQVRADGRAVLSVFKLR